MRQAALVWLALALILGMLRGATASGQTASAPVARVSGSLDIPPYSTASPPGRIWDFRLGHVDLCGKLSPAEEQHLIGAFRRIYDVFRRTAPLSPPLGVEVRPTTQIGPVGPAGCDRLPAVGDLMIQIFRPTIAIAIEAQGSMWAFINPEAKDGTQVTCAAGSTLARTGTVDGWPVVGRFQVSRGGWQPVRVLLTRIPRPFCIPVTREQMLSDLIAETRRSMASLPAVGQEVSPYQRWMQDAPQRKQQREDALRSMAGLMRADSLARFRAQMERADSVVGAGVRAEEAQWLSTATRGNQAQRSRLAALERQLQSMGAAERASAAWVGAGYELVPAGTPRAVVLVKMNPEFYDRSRPPTDVQAILVQFVTYSSPHVLSVQGAVFRALDWAAIAAILD